MRRLAFVLVSLSLAASAGARIAERHPPREVQRPPNTLVVDSRQKGPGLRRDVEDIRQRVERARENGTISRHEARQLRREARLIAIQAHRYGRDGLSSSERAELESRAHSLRGAVNRPRAQGGGGNGRR
ncbi:MAG TPA: hypothetical protein VK391_03920 [Allosphingosinicella sp.]|nr:hypothetical protein [Allosphingosinicella sp.]